MGGLMVKMILPVWVNSQAHVKAVDPERLLGLETGAPDDT